MTLTMKPRFWILAAIAVLISALCTWFSGCTQEDRKSAGSLEKITLAIIPPPFTVLVDIALASGFFRQEGLEVITHFQTTGKAALDEALEGKADVAATIETPVVFAVMNGQKISIITTIQSSSKNFVILARKDHGIMSPQDLKGKRIAATTGTAMEFFADAFMSDQGISRKEVSVVNLLPEKMPDALAEGDVDAISTWPSYLHQAQEKLGDKGIIFYGEDIYTQTCNLVAMQKYIRNNPGKIKKMLRALVRTEEFVAKNPAAAQKIVAEFRKVAPISLSNTWEGNTFSVTLDQSLVLALEDESRWAIKNVLPGKTTIPDYLDYIYLDGLISVKPKAVRLIK
jgi:sulfonate transport system substrate-binding protein